MSNYCYYSPGSIAVQGDELNDNYYVPGEAINSSGIYDSPEIDSSTVFDRIKAKLIVGAVVLSLVGMTYAKNDIVEATKPPTTAQIEQPQEQNTGNLEIDQLVNQINISVDRFNAFTIDKNHIGAFSAELPERTIKPEKFVGHWTASTYENGVDHFISSISNRPGKCCNVMFFIDKNGNAFQFTEANQMTSHARGANSFTQGVEIEASGLNDLSPKQLESFIYLSLSFMREQGIPVERANFLGHMEIDEMYDNGDKPDMPPVLMDPLFDRLKQLDLATQTK
ncbi:N-acetylmuramoyl-L-alanine amidase [Candidatus Saccharibacteria bacterium CPR2]|nr:N-acetylmuramoyl-L-alanine amidase [Candidatus Saccharibacteria bacterium CPR2]